MSKLVGNHCCIDVLALREVQRAECCHGFKLRKLSGYDHFDQVYPSHKSQKAPIQYRICDRIPSAQCFCSVHAAGRALKKGHGLGQIIAHDCSVAIMLQASALHEKELATLQERGDFNSHLAHIKILPVQEASQANGLCSGIRQHCKCDTRLFAQQLEPRRGVLSVSTIFVRPASDVLCAPMHARR